MSMTQDQLEYQRGSARLYQERYDNALRQIGMRAPQPVLGQSPNAYRREVMRTLKRTYLQNHEFGRINMRGLPDEVLPEFEKQVVAASIAEAENPRNVPRRNTQDRTS